MRGMGQIHLANLLRLLDGQLATDYATIQGRSMDWDPALATEILDNCIRSIYEVATARREWSEPLDAMTELVGAQRVWIEAGCNSTSMDAGVVRQPLAGGYALCASACRAKNATEVFAVLVPHLNRALQLDDHIAARIGNAREIGAAITETISVAMLVLRRSDQAISHANSRARKLIETASAFSIHADRLSFASRSIRRSFIDALNAVDAEPDGHYLLVRDCTPVLTFLCCRLDRCTNNFRDGDINDYVAVFVTDDSAISMLEAGQLRERFGLTAKEARLAIGIATGKQLDELAVEFSVSQHTLRAQLKSVRKKLGVGSQADLVSRIFVDPRLLFQSVPL